jgi:hypothetical protein
VNRIGKEPGDVTVARALSWLDGVPQGAPVFLWVHLYDAHGPYRTTEPDAVERSTVVPCDWSAHPAALRRSPWHPVRPMKDPIPATYRCGEKRWDKLVTDVAGYRGAVRYLDAQVGALVAGLKTAGRWEDAGVIVVADHGESLYEHQQHITHQYSLYDPVLRVPLFIRARGRQGIRTEPVSTVRIAATLRDLAGLPPDPSIAGPSLLEVGDDHPVALGPAPIDRILEIGAAPAQSVARWGGLKVLVDEAGHVERYDLAADPSERRPALLEAEQEAIRVWVQGRISGARSRNLMLMNPPGKPGLTIRNALQQAGVQGQLLSAPDSERFRGHEAAARAALEVLRSRPSQTPATGDLPDEVQLGLEALGYLQ